MKVTRGWPMWVRRLSFAGILLVAAITRADMWLSFSADLKHWGDHRLLMAAREGAWWDADKIGLGPPPLETEEGWLILYHGVKQTAAGSIYRLGLALLDLEDTRAPHRQERLVGFCPGSTLRADRRRGQCRFSMWVDT